MKRRKPLQYRFKYLLHPRKGKRFNSKEAELLSEDEAECALLLRDLSVKPLGYRKNVIGHLSRHAPMFRNLIGRIESLPVPPTKKSKFSDAKLLKKGDPRFSPTGKTLGEYLIDNDADCIKNEPVPKKTRPWITFVGGGLPGSGKRR